MTPKSRRMSFLNVVIERDTDSEESSSDDEPEDEEGSDAKAIEEVDEDEVVERVVEEVSAAKKRDKAPITISLKKVCKVCKRTGHEAGFKGATYVDCPMKPCFLCKMPGHTTMKCPHRIATEHGVIPAPHRTTHNSLDYVFERQLRPGIAKIKPAFVIPDEVNCAVIRYHSRRVTCLEFHPTNNNILLSGDKKGQLGVWDYVKVHEKIVYGNVHGCILNNMKFNSTNDGTVYTASSDGTIGCTDLETGISLSLMNLNPGGWQGPSSWRMLYGLDVNLEKGLLLVADNFGFLYLDPFESLVVIGRYISENYNGVALHPIDFIDISTGQLISEVTEPNITTISPVNKLHPRDDVLASGSSRSIFIWRQKENSEIVQPKDETKIIVCGRAEKKLKKKFEGESDDSDNDIFTIKGKNSKSRKSAPKPSHRSLKGKR
ncbi:Protein DAMAGED DNA-BINDING like [Actinidia chinensis var. chinensis]|uniref:Protein DAMAGED DNA-BINDING like n=1 Tax=Actinidia chinensis var. chinensis TaxID=1590841 RepID=A0A2R6QJA5_ACTCC|nr:Protein DAMAGED DNA-BINDING like [Actinidia chinensis var. chinensis]